MLLIWNQLHLKEKAFKPRSWKNELDCKYSLDVREVLVSVYSYGNVMSFHLTKCTIISLNESYFNKLNKLILPFKTFPPSLLWPLYHLCSWGWHGEGWRDMLQCLVIEITSSSTFRTHELMASISSVCGMFLPWMDLYLQQCWGVEL